MLSELWVGVCLRVNLKVWLKGWMIVFTLVLSSVNIRFCLKEQKTQSNSAFSKKEYYFSFCSNKSSGPQAHWAHGSIIPQSPKWHLNILPPSFYPFTQNLSDNSIHAHVSPCWWFQMCGPAQLFLCNFIPVYPVITGHLSCDVQDLHFCFFSSFKF